MRIDTKYDIGESVYLKTDTDQKQRIVRQITIKRNSQEYCLVCGTEESWHEEFEFTTEKDVLKSIE